MSFSVVITSKPPAAVARATTRCIELVPMSIAARTSDVTDLVSEVVTWIVRMDLDSASDDLGVDVGELHRRCWEAGTSGLAEVASATGTDLLVGFDDRATAEMAVASLGGTIEAVDPTHWAAPPPSVTRIAGPPALTVSSPDATVVLADDEIGVVIDAGPTFGHGAHPTTTLALERLVEIAGRDVTVLDVGAGSGVLGIVAARLGAEVWASELDPAAHDVIADNADGNGVRVDLVGTDLVDAPPVDVVVANLLLVDQRSVAPLLAARAGSTLLLTGVLTEQVDELRALHPSRPLLRSDDLDGWTIVTLGPHTALEVHDD